MEVIDRQQEADAILRRLVTDFDYYSRRALKIKNKAGAIIPFNMNKAQLYVHGKLEGQRQATGKVRALLLKMRQGGLSTYIEGRFYHRVSTRPGQGAFILTHEQQATDNLFDMVDRYYKHDNVIHPFLGKSNAKELNFSKIDSGYAVGTAGTKAVGRSRTIQMFHGSEAAFWPNAKEHMTGIGQTIPDLPGTEIILETTGNGMGNPFHQMWQAAEAGASEYIPIFVPWFWDEGYARPVPPDFEFSAEDREVQILYALTSEQLYWRHRKIQDDFFGDVSLFQQEYPANSVEAFIGLSDTYIPTLEVVRARKRRGAEALGATLVGVDPARFGDDSTAIVWRRGRTVPQYERIYSKDTMEIAGRVARIIHEDTPDKVFIDIVGLGVGTYDRLIEMGYQGIVVGVSAGKAASEPDKFFNKRAEMAHEVKEWIKDGGEVPDVDEFQADLLAPKYTYDSNQRLKIESKEDMRKRDVRSPDLFDGLGLTFAFPVHTASADDHGKRGAPRPIQRNVSWRAR